MFKETLGKNFPKVRMNEETKVQALEDNLPIFFRIIIVNIEWLLRACYILITFTFILPYDQIRSRVPIADPYYKMETLRHNEAK